MISVFSDVLSYLFLRAYYPNFMHACIIDVTMSGLITYSRIETKNVEVHLHMGGETACKYNKLNYFRCMLTSKLFAEKSLKQIQRDCDIIM